MPQSETPAIMPPTLDYDTTIIGALELSENKWMGTRRSVVWHQAPHAAYFGSKRRETG
jgi:hypothetical protein